MVARASVVPGALVALGVLAAGCLSPGSDGALEPADDLASFALDWAERALPNGEDHDHYARAEHVGFTTPNFKVVVIPFVHSP